MGRNLPALDIGETDTFHVVVNKLNPGRNYALSVWADRESGLGTRDASDTEPKAALARAACGVKVLRQELEEQSQAYIWNLELRGCAVGEAGLTAYILDRTGRNNVSDYREVARVDTSVTVETPPPPPVTAPGRPTISSVNAGYQELVVNWSAPDDDGGAAISGYYVRHRLTSPSTSPYTTTWVSSGTRHTISGLSNGASHRVSVSACNHSQGSSNRCSSYSISSGGTPRNERPSLAIGSTNLPFNENSTAAIGRYVATDTDPSGGRIEYTLPEVSDHDKFRLSPHPTSGVNLHFRSAPDYENPEQSGATDNRYVVTIRATDYGVPRRSRDRTVTVDVTNVNEMPSFSTTVADREYTDDGPIMDMGLPYLELPFADSDEQPLTYRVEGTPPRGLNIHITPAKNFIDGTPAIGTTGAHQLRYIARDPQGDEADISFSITINRVPHFQGVNYTPPPLYLDAPFTTALPEASGGDGDLEYKITNLPGDLSFSDATRVLSGTPGTARTVDLEYQAVYDDGDVGTLIIPFTVEAKLVPVTGFDVVPRPGRTALITWDPSINKSDDTVYDLYYRNETGTDTYSEESDLSATGHVVDLDTLWHGTGPALDGRGLRGSSHFKFWVVARDETGVKSDSGASESITIVEGPIVEVNGNSEDHSTGRATVKWEPQTDVTQYRLRWKPLRGDTLGRPHTHYKWALDAGALRLQHTGELLIDNPSAVSATINPLQWGTVYAIHLSYTRETGGVEEKVFAASDWFVYPSKAKAAGGNRIATVPLTAHLPQTTYSYILCESSFPVPTDLWAKFVDHAFQQWRIATNGLVTLDRINGTCTDFSPFVAEVVTDVEAAIAAQGLLGVVLTTAEIEVLVTSVLNRFDQSRIASTRARDDQYSEVEIYNDTLTEPWHTVQNFEEISKSVGLGHCETGCAATSNPGSATMNSTTDIVISLSHINQFARVLTAASFPGGDTVPSKGDVHFNSCGETNEIYKTLVHESGHALGIGYGNTGTDQARHHPNERIIESALSYGVEHGCFPHPLDIMALYAIYQTVDTR